MVGSDAFAGGGRKAKPAQQIMNSLMARLATDALPEDLKKETKQLDKEIEKLFENFPPK